MCELKKVDSVESSLHFQLSSQTEGQVKTPLGLLHLNLNVDPNEPKSTLTIEFTHSELLSFYQILENIQDQLDNIMWIMYYQNKITIIFLIRVISAAASLIQKLWIKFQVGSFGTCYPRQDYIFYHVE